MTVLGPKDQEKPGVLSANGTAFVAWSGLTPAADRKIHEQLPRPGLKTERDASAHSSSFPVTAIDQLCLPNGPPEWP
jgi:hypothetical protein